METGRSCADYTCKSLRGHTGRIVGFGYLLGSSVCSEEWNSTPVVCSASTDGTVRAWDVQQGAQLWASPAQSALCDIAVDQEKRLVFTSDTTGLVKAWEGLSGREVASFPTSSSGCRLLPCGPQDQPLLAVGTNGGSLYTLSSPCLTQLSCKVVCDTFRINLLLSSPDRKWLFAGTKENADFSPQVFSSESLSGASEADPPLCRSVPVLGCVAAAFLPSEPARVVLIHSSEDIHKKAVSVFSIHMKKSKYKEEILVEQVETFQLDAGGRDSDVLLHTRGSDTLVIAQANTLRVYTLKGAVLASFEDHTEPIAAVCVDSFRVVTASRDLSLRVLTWKKDRDSGLSLQSRYHLLGGSHTMSRGFTGVACDYVSIVASVEAINGKDSLKAYSFSC